MSELLTMQDLANGHLDVKALGEAANGDENTIVTTRTGNTYPSAERAINIMFKNGGLPAKPFATKAKMETEGASLADGQLTMVYNDTANNGLYVKTAGAWVKSTYDPALKAIDFFKSSSDLHLLPSSSTGVNYDIASKTLSFEGSVRLSNGSTNIVVPTPSSITFPSSGLYRIFYDHSTQSLGFDNHSTSPKSDQSFVALCSVSAIGFVAYGIPHYTVNGKENTTKTEGSYYGNITTNWVFSNISGSGTLISVGGKGRLLSDLIPLKGTINVESSDPNIRIGLMVYNKYGSANRLIPRDTTVSEKIDGYYRVIISYEDSSDLELTDADKVSITAKANIPDELMKRTEVIPDLELGSISYTSGNNINESGAFRNIDFIKMSGTVSVKPISPDVAVRLYLYDKDKQFVKSFTHNAYVPDISNADVEGYFKVSVKYMTDKVGELTPSALAVKVVAVSPTDSLLSDSIITLDALKNLPNTKHEAKSKDLWRDVGKLSYVRVLQKELDVPIYRSFPTHVEIYAFMDKLVADFPSYVTKFNVGLSELGVPIYGYRLKPNLYKDYTVSTTQGDSELKGYLPKIIFNGGLHGNEIHCMMACLLFVDDVCRQWQDIDGYADFRWGLDMVYVPLVNPDGYNAKTNNNTNGLNVNRSFSETPTAESQALMNLMTEHNDAFFYMDCHRCLPETAKIWIATDNTELLGTFFKSFRDVTINIRSLTPEFANDPDAVGLMTKGIITSASWWANSVAGIPSCLLETPSDIGVGGINGAPTTLHARDAIATVIKTIYGRELLRLELNGITAV